ncbi:hypothetical protein [Actinomycetospora termitidis]|uniref:Uncharacterized protein n=1 Tax=Actinomycetospora termitidis TaxID=3053470 RepID=A0ABT7MER5_9PSEU|nr:hypothetical protein [Actinomycetospora sp. Odt1-22]MDL5159157.1 hypothetical protein [Actinomycetospora sp. Odt1-22]
MSVTDDDAAISAADGTPPRGGRLGHDVAGGRSRRRDRRHHRPVERGAVPWRVDEQHHPADGDPEHRGRDGPTQHTHPGTPPS